MRSGGRDDQHDGERSPVVPPVGTNPTSGDRPASVLGKTFRILDAFGQDSPELSLAELSRAARLPKSTVHRLVADLVKWGGLERVGGRLRPGPRLFDLGGLVPHQRRLRQAAVPFLEDLYEATHEVVHLGVLDGTEVVYAEKIYGHRSAPVGTRVGGRMPAHCTGLGKVMLAYSPPELVERVIQRGLVARTPYTIASPGVLREELAKIAERGVALDREEAILRLACAASAIFDHNGRPVAALSVTGPVNRIDLDRLAPAVRTAALSLTRALHGVVPSREGAFRAIDCVPRTGTLS